MRGQISAIWAIVVWLVWTGAALADPRCDAVATGGTVTLTTVDGQPHCVHQFTAVGTGTFNLLRQRDVTYLIVGGGGGGGAFAGGGGGGGGLRTGMITAVATGNYPVIVGAGGLRDTQSVWPTSAVVGGGNGLPSSALGVEAAGGGGGGTYNSDTNVGVGRPGGSGGGASHNGAAGAGTAGQGSAGGTGTVGGGDSSGGGGGGAGQVGQAGTATIAGKGGDGLESTITGTSLFYAGGGAGGGDTRDSTVAANTGGEGGGGASRNDVASGLAGTNNRGGGGAGGRISGNNALSTGGRGGSGVVILRYRANFAPTAQAGPDSSAQAGTTVTLNGAASTDPENNITSYAWTQISGPAVVLTNAATVQASFTVPQPAGATYALVFQLTVTDAFGATSTDQVSVIAVSTTNAPPFGTGGNSVTDFVDPQTNQNVRVHVFQQSGTFNLAAPGPVQYLIVGGGGGGGAFAGGGGGAGGLRTSTVTVPAGNYPVTVGTGGAGDVRTVWLNTVTSGADGQPSSFFNITAAGGGGGGTYKTGTQDWAGRPGGSGGGASHTGAGGSAAANQGFVGASGSVGIGNSTGGGGGGAGEPGQAGTGALAGRGGNGLPSSITGTSITFAGGGAGGGDIRPTTAAPNIGGAGGGGASSNTNIAGAPGENGRGGGGAGGRIGNPDDASSGGNGGAGVVILRYVINTGPAANAGPAQTVTAFGAVALDGSASSDPDGDVLRYSWTQTGGTQVVLNDAATATSGFTAPQPASGGSENLTFRLTVTDPSGLISTSDVVITVTARTPTQPPPPGSGGAVSEYNDIPGHVTWRAHIFFGNGTLNLSAPTLVDYLIVAGGGGGGNSGLPASFGGGGGGAGGLLRANVALGQGAFPVVVGTGGQGGFVGQVAQNGGNSSFASIVALGGGSGDGQSAGGDPTFPGIGGSGGGGRGLNGPRRTDGAAGTPGQGNSGGNGNGNANQDDLKTGGGGGGAGPVDASTMGVGGNGAKGLGGAGGVGRTSSITGVARDYAGGGGGGILTNSGSSGGASSGGGRGGGGDPAAIPGNGLPNTGGGGGGAGFGRDAGGNGGSGIVVARYVINTGPTSDAGPARVIIYDAEDITVTLNGAGTTDPDDNIVSYLWQQIDGTDVELTGDDTPQPSFTAPPPADGPSEDLIFRLTVTDAFGLTSTSEVTITVQGIAVLVADKDVRVFSEDGSGCDDMNATSPALPALPAAIPGACVEYLITVVNEGDAAAIEINLTDLLPPTLGFQAAALGANWIEGDLVTPARGCAGTDCEVVVQNGVIAAGATATIIIRATIN